VTYRGYTITPRTFQIRRTWRWTLDLVIAYQWTHRTFSGLKTFPTEQAAIRGCQEYGRRIIDGLVPHCSVDGPR